MKAARWLVTLIIVLAAVYRLGSAPPLWWDEGWTLAVAKNTLELGHFGQVNAGRYLPPGLSGHPPVIFAALASFRLFGAGIGQGRLPFALLALLALFVLYRFTARQAGQQAAWGALAAALLLVPRPMIHPLLNGRQVLGDIPAALFILAGAWTFSLAEEKGWPFALLAGISWGLALFTKAQVSVFGPAALLAAVLILLAGRQYRHTAALLLTAVLAYASFAGLKLIVRPLYDTAGAASEPLQGWIDTVGIVLDGPVRARAALIFILSAVPFAAGLAAEGARNLSSMLRQDAGRSRSPAWVLVWACSTGWLAWYLLFSNAGERYLATPLLLAAPFCGAFLARATAGFQWRETIRRGAAVLRHRAFRRRNVSALFAAVTLPILVPLTLLASWAFLHSDNDSLLETAAFLNAETPSGGLVETYEAELFIFLEPQVHFPPNQVHIDLLRRYVYNLDSPVDYDPLAASPAFIVVGPVAGDWGLYQPLLESGALELVRDFGRYRVYRPAAVSAAP